MSKLGDLLKSKPIVPIKLPTGVPQEVKDAMSKPTGNDLPYPKFLNKDGTPRDISKPVVQEQSYKGWEPEKKEFKGTKGAALEKDYTVKSAAEIGKEDYT